MLPAFIGTTKRLFQKILVIGKPYTPVYTERKAQREEYQKNAGREVMRQVYEPMVCNRVIQAKSAGLPRCGTCRASGGADRKGRVAAA